MQIMEMKSWHNNDISYNIRTFKCINSRQQTNRQIAVSTKQSCCIFHASTLHFYFIVGIGNLHASVSIDITCQVILTIINN